MVSDSGDCSTVTAYRRFWHRIWQQCANAPLPALPEPKVFKPKLDLPRLACYRANAPDSFWEKFPSNLAQHTTSLVDHLALARLAEQTRYPHHDVLGKVLKDLESGAVIGCKPPFRVASRATNAPSAYADGYKVTDAIGTWLVKGFACGPLHPSAVPPTAKFSGIMTRAKPDGSVRIILNLSAPAGRSVNDGIDSGEFPTSMSSTRQWLEVLHRTGQGALICKCDWSDAYKHIGVAPEDTDLQYFEWLGACFKELSLVFGGASSAGIFDRLAKVVLHIVVTRANFPRDWLIQHLDDVCASCPANSPQLAAFDEEFSRVAAILGVRLAPRDDPEKSFGPSTSGTVLGVHYDTVSWTWTYPQPKLIRLLHDLHDLLKLEEAPFDRIQSVVGKILHVHVLIPDGRFHLLHLLKANAAGADPHDLIQLHPHLKEQMWFWFTILRTCSGRASIPSPYRSVPPWAVQVYTDAAGGSPSTPGLGCGAVTQDWWLFVPWSRAINTGRATVDGRTLDRCMSALELIGPLTALCANPSAFRGLAVQFWVDNAGSVFIWQKGYSTSCQLSSTLVLALATVAAGIGCRVDIVKIRRCSTPLADMSDALSKSDFRRFWALSRSLNLNLPVDPLPVPSGILAWVANPRVDWGLGDRLLHGLRKRTRSPCL